MQIGHIFAIIVKSKKFNNIEEKIQYPLTTQPQDKTPLVAPIHQKEQSSKVFQGMADMVKDEFPENVKVIKKKNDSV